MRRCYSYNARCRWFVLASLAVSLVGLSPARGWAQAAKKITIPPPEMLSFDAAGGVSLQCYYFPGGYIQKSEKEVITKPGKEVVPIILLHGFEGRAGDYSALAFALQRMGHAVLVPDLRGHGGSNKYKRPDGKVEVIELDKMGRVDFNFMVQDLELLKKFLYDKNNEGLLNVESLCLVGADLGATVATLWVALDWSRPDLPAFKQGKSAKALILLSPAGSIKGFNATAAWKHPIFQSNLMSIMLVAGQRDSKSYGEVKQIHNRIERHHKPADDSTDPARKSLWLVEPDTELSGTKLIDPRYPLNVPVPQEIFTFINARLVARQNELSWAERRSPL